MTTLTFFPYAPLIIALLSLAGLAAVVLTDNDNPQVQANQDNILFLLNQTARLTQTDTTILEAVGHQSIRSASNTDLITELQDYDITIGKQVGDIRSDIKNRFPQASDVDDEGQSSSIPGIPFLTLKMEKREFFLGNTIIFSGMAHPNAPIFLTLKDPDRALWQIPVSTAEIIDGQYMANYTLRLDDPIGTWQVYARQISDSTKPLTFTVE